MKEHLIAATFVLLVLLFGALFFGVVELLLYFPSLCPWVTLLLIAGILYYDTYITARHYYRKDKS